VSGGYQWLYVDSSAPEPTNPIAPAEDEGTQFPFGLAVDGSRNFGAFGIVAEGGWSIRSEGDDPDDILFNFWHAGGGVRWTSRRNVTIWPYVQVLGGVAVQNTSGDIAGLDIGDTKAYPMIQPGGGVTFVVGDGWGIFGAGDYRRVFVDEEDGSALNEFRVFVGFRMILD
jgi:hypothetical protein